MRVRYNRRPTLGDFATMVLGGAMAATSVATGVLMPSGTVPMTLGAGMILTRLSDEHRKRTETVLRQFRRELEREWRTWTAHASHLDEEMLDRVILQFNDVIGEVRLDVGEIVSARLDAEGMADLMVLKAETARPAVYGPRSPLAHEAALSRKFLWDLTFRAYRYLVTIPDFMDMLAPELWHEVLAGQDRIEARLDRGFSDQSARLDRMEALLLAGLGRAASPGLTEDALIALARRVAGDVNDPDSALRELENAVEIAARVQAGDEPDLSPVASLSRQGDHDAAAAEIDALLAREDAAHAARQVALLEAGVDQDLLRRDATSAAQRLVRRADLLAGGSATFPDLQALWREHWDRGLEAGLVLHLAVAHALLPDLLDRARTEEEAGLARNMAGVTLHVWGDREATVDRLWQAVAAFGAALDHWSRDALPEMWAKAVMNEANSRVAIAERTGDPAPLEAAIPAYAEAAAIHETGNPAMWAMVQTNLGNALRIRAQLTGDPGDLPAARAAYGAALSVRTRDETPVPWALTRLNEGRTGLVSFHLTGDTQGLDGAERAAADAQAALTEEAQPVWWGLAAELSGECAAARGHVAKACDWFDRAARQIRPDTARTDWARLSAARARAGLAAATAGGDPAELAAGRARAGETVRRLSEAGFDHAARALAEACAVGA